MKLERATFSKAGTGKGAPDAIGGSVKRQADALVLKGIDVPDAKKLFNFLDTNSAIKFYFIESSEIKVVETIYPEGVKPINGTMKLHQLLTDEKLVVMHRDLSCFCQRPTTCNRFNLRKFKFPRNKNSVSITAHYK